MEIKSKCTMIWGVVLMTLSIIMGAMGAHALESVLDESLLKSYQTGVNYMIYQGLAFMGLSFLANDILRLPTRLMKIGISFFSGSIFALVFFKHIGFEVPKIIVFVTPLGGTLLIAGWLILLIKLIRD